MVAKYRAAEDEATAIACWIALKAGAIEGTLTAISPTEPQKKVQAVPGNQGLTRRAADVARKTDPSGSRARRAAVGVYAM